MRQRLPAVSPYSPTLQRAGGTAGRSRAARGGQRQRRVRAASQAVPRTPQGERSGTEAVRARLGAGDKEKMDENGKAQEKIGVGAGKA